MGFWSRWKRTLLPDNHSGEIEEELRYHLAMQAQEESDERGARLRFGNLTRLKEETRSEGVLPWLESFARDLRYASRQMRRAPLFTLILVASLALGIGANTAIFSLVDAALLKSLPVQDPHSIRVVEWSNHGFPDALCNMMSGDSTGDSHTFQGSSISAHVYRELAHNQHQFAFLIGFSDISTAAVSLNKLSAEQFHLQYISANFFSGLGAALQLGRPFSSTDDRLGQPPLIILSDRFWQNQFGRRSDILGQVLRVNNVPVEVVGVAHPGFFGLQIGEWVDLYAPLAAQTSLSPQAKLDNSFSDTDRYWWVRMIGRLKPGLAEPQARQELSALFQRLVVPSGATLAIDKTPRLVTLPGERGVDSMGADQSRALWILLLLVGLILLIVCANVANLLLSRAVVRQRESAVCLALGAARFRLFAQYLTESLVLAAMGGCAGLFLGYLLAHLLHAFIRADMDIGGFDLHPSALVLAFTCTVSLATAVLCGVAPAWTLARATVHDALKTTTRTIAAGRLRLPRLLLIAQLALSFSVLIGAGLLARSLSNLRHVDLGFSRANLVYASVNPWSAGYRPEQVNTYVAQLRSVLASVPGVLHVALVELRPLSGDANISTIHIPGHTYKPSDMASVNQVSDGFFETLDIPLLAGRTFTPADMRKQSDAALTDVVVDDLFAHRFYGSRNPLNETFGTIGPAIMNRYRIIGVVESSRYNSLRETRRPGLFLPSATGSHPGWRVNFVIRTALSTGQLSRAFRQASSTIDPAVPVIAIETQTGLVDALLRSERLLSIFSSAFGLLALILSSIGLLGLLAYMVAGRTNEIGVRMALGASGPNVAAMVVKDALLLLLIGLAAGLPGALLLGRVLKHTLFNLQPFDPATALLAFSTMMAVGVLSIWIPAQRAAHIDPMRALRNE